MCKALEAKGWIRARIASSHHVYKRPGTPFTITVPVHGNKDLALGTQHRIMRDAGLTEADL